MKPYKQQNTITNPVGIDAAIETVCTALESLPWLTLAFRRAWLIPSLVENRVKNEWKVLAGSDYLTLTKDPSVPAFSLVTVSSGESYEKAMTWYDDNTRRTRSIGIVFVVDLKWIKPDRNYIYTEELKAEIIDKLKTVEGLDITEYHDNDNRRIFEGLTVDGTGFEWVLYPFAAMRFNGTLNYNLSC